jgi:dTDP-4-amino-4,6-dideoxygalactose transaminase
VLICQLERLPAQIARRTSNAALLKHLLADVEEIVWQTEPEQQTQNPHYLLTGRLRNARVDHTVFCDELTARGIPCAPFYPHTLYQNPVYLTGECRVLPCPVAEARILDAFWLGHRLLLADEETIQESAAVIRSAISGRELLSQPRALSARPPLPA